MTREEARKAAEVMLAFANGENIHFSHWGKEDWKPRVNPTFQFGNYRYRVQSGPKYRPFKDADECWEEMKKHEPFGWIKNPVNYFSVIHISDNGFTLCSGLFQTYSEVLKNDLQFIDVEPFGIKED